MVTIFHLIFSLIFVFLLPNQKKKIKKSEKWTKNDLVVKKTKMWLKKEVKMGLPYRRRDFIIFSTFQSGQASQNF